MSRGEIFVETKNMIEVITISNPDKKNALNDKILKRLSEEAARASKKAIRVLIIKGAGDSAFCSGYDISEIPEDVFISDVEAYEKSPFNRTLNLFEEFPYATIAYMNGHTFGGGLELSVCCDIRIAVKGAKMGMTPAKLGLIYSHTGLQKFINLIGVAKTKELFYAANPISSEEAERIGLVNHAVERKDAENFVMEMAKAIAENAPISIKGMKTVISKCLMHQNVSYKEYEDILKLRNEAFLSSDFKEGQAAFLAKRKPIFKGR